MPIYDYHCDHCGYTFAAVGGFNDPPLAICARCGKEPRRLIAATAIVFKGSGWYKTDSRAASPNDDGAPKPTAATTTPTTDATAPPTAESSAPAGGNDKASESKPAGSKSGSTPAAAGGTELTGRSGDSVAAPGKSKPAVAAIPSPKSKPASPR